MNIDRFEQIEAWQAARRLTDLIYRMTEAGGFSRDFALRDQTRKAAISTMNNIAEGFGRSRPREFVRFLTYTLGSAAEVQSCLYVALDRGYISHADFQPAYDSAHSVTRLSGGFIRYLSRLEGS